MKMNDEIFEDQVNPMHKQSGGALLSDAEFYIEEHKMRGSHTGGFSAAISPTRLNRNVNKIHPGTLNQSVDGGIFSLQTIGIRPHQSPNSRGMLGAEQGYIGDLNNNLRQANAVGFSIPDPSDRQQNMGNSVQYDSNRPMIGAHLDQRQELFVERIADHSLEVLENPNFILPPRREEHKHEINEEEKLMDEICKEQEESSEHHVPVHHAHPLRSSF